MGKKRSKVKIPKSSLILTTMVKVLELPEEVMYNTPLITLTGKKHLAIENYTALGEYTPSEIKIITSLGTVRISGSDMCISEICTSAIVLQGKFKSIEYETG